MTIKILNENFNNLGPQDLLDEIEFTFNNLIYEFEEYKKINELATAYSDDDYYQEKAKYLFKKIYNTELPNAMQRLDDIADYFN